MKIFNQEQCKECYYFKRDRCGFFTNGKQTHNKCNAEDVQKMLNTSLFDKYANCTVRTTPEEFRKMTPEIDAYEREYNERYGDIRERYK